MNGARHKICNVVRLRLFMQSYERELRRFSAVEQALATIPSNHIVGCLWIDNSSIKASLAMQLATWKAQYAKNLRTKGHDDLRVGNHLYTKPLSHSEFKSRHLRKTVDSISGLVVMHCCSLFPTFLKT